MARSAMRARIAPRFPARIQGTDGVAVDRSGGVVTIRQDWSNIQTGVVPPDPASFEVLFRQPDTSELMRVRADTIITPGATWDTLPGKPTTFPPSAHTHPISGVVGLEDALASKLDDAQATAAGLAMLGAANAGAQTVLLSPFTGDSGSGGVKGLVPAPAAGDTALARFLKADGSWQTPAWSSVFYDAVMQGGLDNTGATVVDLQVVCDAANTAKRSLYIPIGTYNAGDKICSPYENQIILGAGRGTVIQRSVNVGAASYDAARPPVFFSQSKNYVKILSLSIEYTAGASTTPATNSSRFSAISMESGRGCVVDDVFVKGRFYTGIAMTFSTDWRVERSTVKGVVNRGIYINGSADNFTIDKCLVDGAEAVGSVTRFTNYGINMLPSGASSILRGSISNCMVQHTTDQGIAWSGLTSDVWAVGCRAYNVGNHGFLWQNIVGDKPQFNGATGCTAHLCGANGFYILNSNYVMLSGNTGRSNTNANLELDGAQFCRTAGMILQASAGYGAWLKNSSNNTIGIAEMVSNNFGLIEAASCASNIFVGNHFTANTTTNVSTLGAGSLGSANL